MITSAVDRLAEGFARTSPLEPEAAGETEIGERLFNWILRIPNDVANKSDNVELFGHGYVPGTFMIGEAERESDFLLCEMSVRYERWLRHEIRSDIKVIKQALVHGKYDGPHLANRSIEGTEENIMEILDHEPESGKRLCDLITLQEYTDMYRRYH